MHVAGVKVNLKGLESMLSGKSIERAQLRLAADVSADCQVLVPWDTHATRDSMTVSKDRVSWETPYAIYAYYMRGRPSKPGTYADWFEVASRRHLKDWEGNVLSSLMEEVS